MLRGRRVRHASCASRESAGDPGAGFASPTLNGAAARLAALGPVGPPLTGQLRCAAGSIRFRGRGTTAFAGRLAFARLGLSRHAAAPEDFKRLTAGRRKSARPTRARNQPAAGPKGRPAAVSASPPNREDIPSPLPAFETAPRPRRRAGSCQTLDADRLLAHVHQRRPTATSAGTTSNAATPNATPGASSPACSPSAAP
jgi:hypothetical protein